MSRWGRGRGGSVAVPLDHLFRENSNCPSAARSSGTVGKWGITSFTSTRSAPYSFGNDVAYQRKPKQDQNSPLTVPALEANVPPPKPKKFFKSRNVDPSENATLPTSSVAPPPPPEKAFPSFSKKEEKQAKPVSYAKKQPAKIEIVKSPVEKMEIPKLKIHVERSPKSNKSKFFAAKPVKKDEPPIEEKTHLSPNKRYLVRNRDKVINYSEDRSNSPPVAPVDPAFTVAPIKVTTPKTSPASAVTTPTYVKPGLMSPTNKDGKPPIVLRISKGTSRLLSTDSEDVLASPAADRHSFSEQGLDGLMEDEPLARVAEAAIVSPPAKQESLKITIKCYSSTKDKSTKIKSEKIVSKVESISGDADKESGHSNSRATRSSRRNQHKDVDEGARGNSPTPGSDNYELYRTLASPPAAHLTPKHSPDFVPKVVSDSSGQLFEDHPKDDVEMTLARLESGKPLDDPILPKNGVLSIRLSQQTSKEESRANGGKEGATGRAMRHRANINYNENAANFIDDITTTRFNRNPAKSYSRKSKKKTDVTSQDEEMPLEGALPEVDGGAPSESHSEQVPHSLQSDEQPDPSTEEVSEVRNVKKTVKSTLDFDDGPAVAVEPGETVQEKSSKLSDKQCKPHTFKSPKRLLSESSPNSVPADDKPSVKLVITKKKGSIFKSRSLVNDEAGATGKKRHLYKHKWADDGKGGQTPRPEPEPSAQAALQEFEESTRMLTKVTRYQKNKSPSMEEETEAYTSVKCPKNAKDYYTVVRNVKKAHQIQEIGEFQEFNDDVEYILDALQDNNPMATRCLSAITLASKCTAPAFRMHVRAHGTVAKFFRALHDATMDQSLGLCTATVMFVLSQDRLNMDLDRESLELMLNLLESDVSHKDALDDCGLTSVQLAKNKERVRELCAEIKSQGKAKHLDLDNITVGHLAMETLLSLTSKRAGEWFKEELRALGGVEHILSTICECCARIGDYVVEWSPALLDLLRKIDRCMRVLENVTQQNEENQTYLVGWKNGFAVDTLVKLFRLCDREIPLYPTGGSGGNTPLQSAGGAGATVRDALLPTLKVLVNLTHPFSPNSLGSTVVGERPGIIDASLHLLLQAPNYIPDHNNFEFSVCVLLLLINLMQNNSANIKLLVNAQAPPDLEAAYTCNKPATQALIDHFYKREELARLAEKNTDAILDGEKVKEDETKEKKNKSHDEFIEETMAKLLQKAGTHMEHTLVASYIVLLLGHVVTESAENEDLIRRMLPQQTFQDMLTTLRKYFSFLNLTASAEAASVAHIKATEKIINYLDNCDKQHLSKAGQPGPSGYSNGESPSSSQTDKESSSPAYIDYSTNTDAANSSHISANNFNVSANDFTSESDRMSSSIDMDTSFN